MKVEGNKIHEGLNEAIELLRNLVIIELTRAGVRQVDIRKVLGVDMVRVNSIARYLKKKRG